MLAHLADISIRSVLLAAPAAVVLWILRRRRTAALQHAVWTAVMCGMLVLFASGQVLPRLPLRVLASPAAAAPASLRPRQGLALETPAPISPPATGPTRTYAIDWIGLALYAYGAVALAFLARFATGMWLARKLLAESHPAQNFLESNRISVPFTVGWLRPRILLPLEWREWDYDKLHAVLAHESAHVRRRDGLAAALAGVNRCVFWFHPLAWFLDRKLALLAEQACDEACVAALGDRRRYAGLLLEMARVVDGSQGRLRGHAFTMAAGSHIRRRIEALLEEGRAFPAGLTRTARVAVALCSIPLVWGAGALELDQQAPPQLPAAPSAAGPRPKFDVASIRPCNPDGQGGNDGGRGGKGGGGGKSVNRSPGRLNVTCMSVVDLIDIAYVESVNDPLVNDSQMPLVENRVRGGPAWAHSVRYTIRAETEDPVANGPTTVFGPAFRRLSGVMLQTLLEDRLQLKIHRDVEEAPMYALTVAKSGLKLKPMQPGDCIPNGPTEWPKGGKPPCGWTGWGVNGPNRTFLGSEMSLSRFAKDLGDLFMDRHIIDRTGVTGLFNIRMEYMPDENTPNKFPRGGLEPVDPASDIPPGPSIFSAIGELGLKLEPIKGPHGFIMIDRVERPSEN